MGILPNNEFALAGYVIVAAFSFAAGSFVVKERKRIVPEDWSQKHQRQFIWGMAIMAYLFSAYALWLAYTSAGFLQSEKPEDSYCEHDRAIEEYLRQRSRWISSVPPKSSAWYKLKSLNTFEHPEIPCENKEWHLDKANANLNKIIQQYNLR